MTTPAGVEGFHSIAYFHSAVSAFFANNNDVRWWYILMAEISMYYHALHASCSTSWHSEVSFAMDVTSTIIMHPSGYYPVFNVLTV